MQSLGKKTTKQIFKSIKTYGSQRVCVYEDLGKLQKYVADCSKKGKITNITTPQKGWQETGSYLSEFTSLIVFHAERGGGKTWEMLYNLLPRVKNPAFSGIAFRKNKEDAEKGEGLIQKAKKMFCPHYGTYQQSSRTIKFHAGGELKFDYFDSKGVENWLKDFEDRMQGGSYTDILFDEGSQIEVEKFNYMRTTLRSISGLNPRIQIACNPNPTSFLAGMVMSYWADGEGWPIEKRSGHRRWYYQVSTNEMIWGDTPEEIWNANYKMIRETYPKDRITIHNCRNYLKECIFVYSSLDSNRILLNSTPGYKASLTTGDEATDAINLYGNWASVGDGEEPITTEMMERFFTNKAQYGNHEIYATADPSWLKKDVFVFAIWEGNHLKDIVATKGIQNADTLLHSRKLLTKYGIPESKFAYDGYNANEMKANMTESIAVQGEVIDVKNEDIKYSTVKFFYNLKAQLAYHLIMMLKKGELSIDEELLRKDYFGKTIRKALLNQRKAIRFQLDESKSPKTRLIPKKQMKKILRGESPDLLEGALLYRMYFELMPKQQKIDRNIIRKLKRI